MSNGMRLKLVSSFLVSVMVLLIWPSQAQQSIIAVDAGASFVKTVLVQPGKLFDIALSSDSKRKLYSSIGILDGVRVFGSESFNLYAKKPKQVVWRVRDLLGRKLQE